MLCMTKFERKIFYQRTDYHFPKKQDIFILKTKTSLLCNAYWLYIKKPVLIQQKH